MKTKKTDNRQLYAACIPSENILQTNFTLTKLLDSMPPGMGFKYRTISEKLRLAKAGQIVEYKNTMWVKCAPGNCT